MKPASVAQMRLLSLPLFPQYSRQEGVSAGAVFSHAVSTETWATTGNGKRDCACTSGTTGRPQRILPEYDPLISVAHHCSAFIILYCCVLRQCALVCES